MSTENFRKLIEILKSTDSFIEEKTYKINETIFQEGDESDGFFLIQKGEVGVYKVLDSNTGKEKELAVLKKDDFFGEGALFQGEPRSATVRALTDLKLVVIKKDKLIDLLKTDPDSALNFLMNIIHVTNLRLQQMNEQLILLYDIGHLIARNKSNLNVLCGEVLKKMIEVSWCESGALFLREPFSENFTAKASFNRGLSALDPEKIKTLGALIWKIKKGDVLKEKDYLVVLIHGTEDKVRGAVVLKTDLDISEERIRLVVTVAEQLGNAFVEIFANKEKDSKKKLGRKYITN